MTDDESDDRLVTERLVLRRMRASDADAVHRIRSLPEVGRWLGRTFADRAAFDAWFTGLDRRDFAVLLDGEFIGSVLLNPSPTWCQNGAPTAIIEAAHARQEAELGWWMDPAVGGRGLATEAVRAVMDHAFGTLHHARLVAHCFAANEPSRRLMERVGMRQEAHHLEDSLAPDGGLDGSYSYALLAREYRALRGSAGPGRAARG